MKTGDVVYRDYVKYGPPHLMDRQVTIARVERILKARKPNESSKNISEWQSWHRAEYIRPLYEAWKKGEELPDDGLPLAALNFLRKEDVDNLKSRGVRSVQELATLPDSVMERISVPGLREKRMQAKRFLEAQDINKTAAEMAARDNKIAELERMIKSMQAQAVIPPDDEPEVDANGDRVPKRRGRPPKIEQHEAA
jgi:hypothetical protein